MAAHVEEGLDGVVAAAGDQDALAADLDGPVGARLVQVGGADLSGPALITFFGYLLAGLVLLPIGFAWSLAERSRGATAVLLIAGLAQAFVVVRALAVWQ